MLDTSTVELWIDTDELGEWVPFWLGGLTYASVAVVSAGGLGSAVLTVRQSFDAVTGVDYAPVKTLSGSSGSSLVVSQVEVYPVPNWVVVVTTASGVADSKVRLRFWGTSSNTIAH